MNRTAGIFVCVLIAILDITAGILGNVAEIAQEKVEHMRVWVFECREPSHKAFMIGLSAAVLLALAHVVVNFLCGYKCFCSEQENADSPDRSLSKACLISTWIAFVIGMGMLVLGTKSNNKSRCSCDFTHHHFLSYGGILCLAHGLLGVAYYASAPLPQSISN